MIGVYTRAHVVTYFRVIMPRRMLLETQQNAFDESELFG